MYTAILQKYTKMVICGQLYEFINLSMDLYSISLLLSDVGCWTLDKSGRIAWGLNPVSFMPTMLLIG